MRRDPFMNFRFRIELNNVQHGGFMRAKGVARETKIDAYREGGLNEYEHKLASLTTYGNIVLERGLVDDYLWSWNEAVVEGRIERRNLTILLVDGTGATQWRWLVEGAFPVKWTGSDLDGASAQTLIETVELAHHGFRRG